VKERGNSVKGNNGSKRIGPGLTIHTLYKYENLMYITDNCVGRKQYAQDKCLKIDTTKTATCGNSTRKLCCLTMDTSVVKALCYKPEGHGFDIR
jgi:hypothetical protein